MKGEEKGEGKWWSIGRGRKDSKEKEKTLKLMATAPARPTCNSEMCLTFLSCSSRPSANSTSLDVIIVSRFPLPHQEYVFVFLIPSDLLTNFSTVV